LRLGPRAAVITQESWPNREPKVQQDDVGHHGVDIEALDLEDLRDRIKSSFGDRRPMGYVPGKTAIRETVVQLLGCSDVEAENLVDTLESLHMIVYEGKVLQEIDDLEHVWRFRNGD
jgi:hypothetical protein